MEVDFASRVGLHVVTKVATPISLWIGRCTLFPLLGPMTPEKAVGLGFLGFGATVIVAVKPEESLGPPSRQASNSPPTKRSKKNLLLLLTKMRMMMMIVLYLQLKKNYNVRF